MTVTAFCKRATFKQRFSAGLIDHGILLGIHFIGTLLGGDKIWQGIYPMIAVVYFSQEFRFKRTIGDRVMNLFLTTSSGHDVQVKSLIMRFLIVYGYFFIMMLEAIHPALRVHDTIFLTLILAVFTGFVGVLRPNCKSFYDDFTDSSLWYSSQTKFGYSGYTVYEENAETSPTLH